MMQMINDTTDGWVEEDDNTEKENNGFITVMKKILVKYAFIIVLFALLASRVIRAFVETRKITVNDVRITCYAIYAALLLAIVFACYYTYVSIKNRMSGVQLSKDLFDQFNSSADSATDSSNYADEDITNTAYNRNSRYKTVVEEYGLPMLELMKIMIEYIVISPFSILLFLSKPVLGDSNMFVSFFRKMIGSIHSMFNINLFATL